jgi:hypothetical protein
LLGCVLMNVLDGTLHERVIHGFVVGSVAVTGFSEELLLHMAGGVAWTLGREDSVWESGPISGGHCHVLC